MLPKFSSPDKIDCAQRQKQLPILDEKRPKMYSKVFIPPTSRIAQAKSTQDGKTYILRYSKLEQENSRILNSKFKKRKNCVESNINDSANMGDKRSKVSVLEEICNKKIKTRTSKQPDSFSPLAKLKVERLKAQINGIRDESDDRTLYKNKKMYREYFKPREQTQFSQIYLQKTEVEQLRVKLQTFTKTFYQKNIISRLVNENRSRYEVQYLNCMHRTLLTHAQGSKKKFQKSLLIVLNLSGILINEERLESIKVDLKNIQSFKKFMEYFKEIEDHHRKQSVEDYLLILFSVETDDYKKIIRLYEIREAFQKRMTKEMAASMTKMIIDRIREKLGISTQEIQLSILYNICSSDPDICQKIRERYVIEMSEQISYKR